MWTVDLDSTERIAARTPAWNVPGVTSSQPSRSRHYTGRPIVHYFLTLTGPAVLSYTLGLRHALYADHISAIDLTTRRAIAWGQQPVTVGTFFSLGHSTVVIVTSIVVAPTAVALWDRFGGFQRVDGIIGTTGNGWILYTLVPMLQELLIEQRVAGSASTGDKADGDVVDRPWKMFSLGLMFGLGFDTSSEIALLGIAGIQGAQRTSIWPILIFPILFTAGMCMLDTTDSALVTMLYTSSAFARDKVAIVCYSIVHYPIVLTSITVVVYLFIDIIQVLSLIQNVSDPKGGFWDGISAIADNFEIVSRSIWGLFLLVGIASVLLYKPWRRTVDRRLVGSEESTPDVSPSSPGDQGVAARSTI
ncbi:high-affinity nickel-transport protein-domain-containing protein [Roridomyces roridus]|uniref:Nickel/cobalt efflux system n=1 Tax=Roridomyces roridus TaxID=1738132 RepID=A0AAD7C762_9AGAR|nr:high-affinity nickel-transport protein-domain-containing protein [Roridomyces roridus]